MCPEHDFGSSWLSIGDHRSPEYAPYENVAWPETADLGNENRRFHAVMSLIIPHILEVVGSADRYTTGLLHVYIGTRIDRIYHAAYRTHYMAL